MPKTRTEDIFLVDAFSKIRKYFETGVFYSELSLKKGVQILTTNH